MSAFLEEDAHQEFQERGFVVVPSLLSAEDVERYLGVLERLSGRTRSDFEAPGPARLRGVYGAWTLPDGVTRTEAVWDLITHEGLLRAVRGVLGADVCYLQHSDLHVGFSALTWHRDSVTREYGIGEDWEEDEEPYRLVRVAFYLQSFAESRFSLRLVAGSHRRGSLLGEEEARRLDRRTRRLSQAFALLSGRDPIAEQAHELKVQAGDAVLFDPRILHSGSPVAGPKYSIFLAYGPPGRHFHRHAAYYRYVRRELGYQDLPPRLAVMLGAAGLLARMGGGEATPRAFRPPRWQKILARRVRPGAPARPA